MAENERVESEPLTSQNATNAEQGDRPSSDPLVIALQAALIEAKHEGELLIVAIKAFDLGERARNGAGNQMVNVERAVEVAHKALEERLKALQDERNAVNEENTAVESEKNEKKTVVDNEPAVENEENAVIDDKTTEEGAEKSILDMTLEEVARFRFTEPPVDRETLLNFTFRPCKDKGKAKAEPLTSFTPDQVMEIWESKPGDLILVTQPDGSEKQNVVVVIIDHDLENEDVTSIAVAILEHAHILPAVRPSYRINGSKVELHLCERTLKTIQHPDDDDDDSSVITQFKMDDVEPPDIIRTQRRRYQYLLLDDVVDSSTILKLNPAGHDVRKAIFDGHCPATDCNEGSIHVRGMVDKPCPSCHGQERSDEYMEELAKSADLGSATVSLHRLAAYLSTDRSRMGYPWINLVRDLQWFTNSKAADVGRSADWREAHRPSEPGDGEE